MIGLLHDAPYVQLRGQLKHSWLENQIMNKSAEDILFLRTGSGWPALEGESFARLDECKRLIEYLEDGFSPAQLIDRLSPFRATDENTRQQLKKSLHEAYLKISTVLARKVPLESAFSALDAALHSFILQWRQPLSQPVEAALRTEWNRVLRHAGEVHAELEALPRSIVLP